MKMLRINMLVHFLSLIDKVSNLRDGRESCHRIMRKSVFEQEYYTFRNGVYNCLKLFRMTYKSMFLAEIIVTENVTMVIHHI